MVKIGKKIGLGISIIILIIFGGNFLIDSLSASKVTDVNEEANTTSAVKQLANLISTWPAQLDTKEYDKRLLDLAHYVASKATTTATDTTVVAPADPVYSAGSNVVVPGQNWPSSAVYPNGDAILPFKRILAYYGNFYSQRMGILGEYEPDEVLRRLEDTALEWEAADPNTPILKAIEYIAMVAQADAGADGMYRKMMPDSEIEKAHALAEKANAILILDLQVGLSTLKQELPKFDSYMMKPDIHLALDPEFSMKGGEKPGTVIGSFNAQDINYTIDHLSNIVRENKLPPKVLLVHRFTEKMVKDSELIRPTPEVQVVIVMDGWGPKDLKRGTYSQVIKPEPVQFAGIKIFYKNDLKSPSTGLLTPFEVLQLNPKPIYIQYQ